VQSRLLLNFGLAAAVIALAAYLFLVSPPEEFLPPYSGLDTSRADSLRISSGIHLIRVGEGWRMTAPHDAPADIAAVERIVSRLPPEVHRRYALDELDLADVGLQPPELSADLTVDGVTMHFAFGSRAPLDGYRYLLADDAVFLTADAVFYLMSGGPSSLLDKHPVSGTAAIDSLQLPGLTLTREPSGWDRQPEDGASSDADQALIDRWVSARAITVTALTEERPDGLDEIIITRAGGEVRSYWVEMGSADLRLYDLDAGLAYELPAGSRSALLGLDRETTAEAD
jgi:Domain of unknown function (DUF4340)